MKNAKLATKSYPQEQTKVQIGQQVVFGGNELPIIGGPCAVENYEQMNAIAQELSPDCIHAFRGGVYKPRTSPYAFQGLGEAGLEIFAKLKSQYNIPIVTEVMAIDQIGVMSEYVDMLQVGSRNMQNFDLLKALGRTEKPILLKRGLASTIEEFVMAAEYILSNGNQNVVLCERGIRSFDNYTRNVLDLAAVAALKQITHLPVIVDPSHAVGKSELVLPLAKAAVACGADGLIIECHPEPKKSVSDARQTLSLIQMRELVNVLRPVAESVGRKILNKNGIDSFSHPIFSQN
ncbi:MAG: 3-deoxy-7-phosphoheptulonate synthase [Mastigocoleus sp.]